MAAAADASEPPPSYSDGYTPQQCQEYQIVELIQKYNISTSLSKMLYILKEFNIVLLVDDSGSMTSPNTLVDPYSGQVINTTRWYEAKRFTSTLVDFAMALDDDGIDLYYINRPPIFGVKNKELVDAAFAGLPAGGTLLVKKLWEIFNNYKHRTKNVLLVIITDGEPNDAGSNNSELFRVFDTMFAHANPKFRASMMICSDDDGVHDVFNKIDRKYDEFDVSDDYVEEKKQIMRVQGRTFNFDYGDYICKILLAPICHQLDMLDERRVDLNYIVKTFTKTYDDYGLSRAITDSKMASSDSGNHQDGCVIN